MHAHQVTGGLFWHYKELDFSAEGYYKRMNNLVEYKDNGPVLPSFEGWEDRVGVGKGRSYGLELMVQKKTGRFNGWIGYTLSWSDRWFPDGTVNKGHRFPSKYDNRHKVDIVASYKLSKKVELTAAWMYKSGNHLTIQDVQYRPLPELTERGYQEELWWGYGENASSRNNYQLPAYHRLDLGANFYRYKKNGRMGIWNLSLCNAYFKANPFSVRPIYYQTEKGGRSCWSRPCCFFSSLLFLIHINSDGDEEDTVCLVPAFVCLLYPRRGAGPSARFSAPGAECFRFAGYGCDGFLVQKLVCLGHGYGRRGRGWQHTSVYKRPFARTYAARFR